MRRARRRVRLLGWVIPLAFAPAQEPGSRHHRIEIRDMAYRPPVVAVAVGDTITWLSRDVVPHTVTLDDGGDRADVIVQGQEIQLIVSWRDSVAYWCRYHPGMTGVLSVR